MHSYASHSSIAKNKKKTRSGKGRTTILYPHRKRRKRRLLAVVILALPLFLVLLLITRNNGDAFSLQQYDKRHFNRKRYLFHAHRLHRRSSSGTFHATATTVQIGTYNTTKRFTHPGRPNFLFVPALGGWIKEVYTSAAPRMRWTPGKNLPIGNERVDKWYALPPNYRPNDLVKLPKRYCRLRQVEMRRLPARAFRRMGEAAARDGIGVYAFSGFRAFAIQKYLYLRRIRIGRKYKQQAVARPGHSEHQLGTTVDVVGKDTSKAARYSFAKTAAARWLRNNCYRFGFVPSYGEDNRIPTGYIKESWHFRYIGKDRVDHWRRTHLSREALRRTSPGGG